MGSHVSPRVEDDDGVNLLYYVFEVVLHHDNRDAARFRKLHYGMKHFSSRSGIEIGGRFIQQQNFWFCDQRGSNGDFLLLTAR